MVELPVLCICFNRLEMSMMLFSRLKSLDVREIYLSIDGPRHNEDSRIQKEIVNVAQTLFDTVHLNRLEKNMGVSEGPVNALDWFFSVNDFGVILEDDILPTKGFFEFVKEMYLKYNGVDRVLTINSGSYSTAPEKFDLKYYYSSYVHIWGWATWSHVWALYKVNISSIDVKKVCNSKDWSSSGEKRYWRRNFLKDYRYHWDFQLSFLSFSLNGINVTPTRTLTQNIGFQESSHIFLSDPVRERKAFDGALPPSSPNQMKINHSIDFLTYLETRSYTPNRVLRLYRANGFIKILKFLWNK